MAYETESELDANGAKRVEGAKMDRALSLQGHAAPARRRVAAGSSGWRRARGSGGTWVCGFDVTDLKNKELEIERARADYQSLVDSLSGHGLRARFKGCLHVRQCRCHRSAGTAGRGVVGERFADFLEAEDLETRHCRRRRAHLRSNATNGVRQINLRMKRADGSIRHMECRYRRPPGGPGQTVAGQSA